MKHGLPSPADLATEEDLVLLLAARLQLDGRRGQIGRAAQDLGVSQGALSNVLTGGRSIGPDIAAALGFRKVVRFELIES